ncbi:MAG: heavy metal translocating P-type ATPase [Gemmatimonadetes bacterium]|nr:heavy metal translocating P-type ATPase [Gemmatimonadota bacterium]
MKSGLDWWRPVAAAGVMIAGQVAPRLSSGAIDREPVWLAGLLFLGAPVVWSTLQGLLQGRFAADVVASLALIGAVGLGEPLVGLVIVLMQTGGEALERHAARRASSAVASLEAQAPRIAHRFEGVGLVDVEVGAIAVGDRLLVRPGEMVPCDAEVLDGRSSLDTSRLTGEPLPRPVVAGGALSSGMVNLDAPLTIGATALAAESLYAKIVDLVRSAEASKAPIQRLADRAAVWFTPLTLLVCALAYFASGDPIRVLAVLVAATPCPLILAAPVAILGGINRAARHQIIVRHGGALEQLAGVSIAVFDKTGTLTVGRPELASVHPIPPFDEASILRLGGAVEQGSGHLLARTFVEGAEARVGRLPDAVNVLESAGRGVSGMVEGRRVTVGALSLLREWEPAAAARLGQESDGAGLRAYLAIDGRPAGSVGYADAIRPEAPAVMRSLGSLGFKRLVMLSGDRQANADLVAAAIGLPMAVGDLLPQDKVAYVGRLAKQGHKVLMVGDGANDAPALSAATVGLALAAHGGGISAEAADVVLLVDDLGRVPEAVAIARRTLAVARQSIGIGLGASLVAMVAAAFGYLTPLAGAVLQEGIDVAVILNALRATKPGAQELGMHEAAG